jgi:hypothetical protein
VGAGAAAVRRRGGSGNKPARSAWRRASKIETEKSRAEPRPEEEEAEEEAEEEEEEEEEEEKQEEGCKRRGGAVQCTS